MRKILFLTILLQTLFFTAYSSPVVINGKWNMPDKNVSLYYIVSGRLEILSTYTLQEDRTFGFSFTPQSPGYYVLGSENPQIRQNKYVFYLRPGDTLQAEFNDDSYALTGENTPQNKAMADWHNKIAPLEFMSLYFNKNSSTYVDFFPLLDEFIHDGYTPTQTGDEVFNRSFEKFRQIDLINIAVFFIHTPRSAHPENEDFSDFYRQINLEELTNDASLLAYPYGSTLMYMMLYLKQRLSNKQEMYTIPEVLSFLQNDTIKGEYLLGEASRIKTYEGYLGLMNPYGQYIVTTDQKKRTSEIIAKLGQANKEGEIAINFTHKDINGKDVSLSDFIGKVVLVDAWATWCGPCKKEMESIQKLEKEFAGKDVVFMCVSVDEAKDKQKWKDFVKNENLEGIQLFSGGFESDIVKFYDIKSIPRFILIDKKGNIVSKDAPRPSSAELRLLIKNELKK